MSFHPGQPVVCVDDDDQNSWGLKEIVAGHVYTVRAMVDPDELMLLEAGRALDEPGVLLVEIRRLPVDPELGEVPFAASRFRPLDATELEVIATEKVPA